MTMTKASDRDEVYRLQNNQRKAAPARFESQGSTQKVLFSGMDCLPGQQDLFPTDGRPSDSPPPRPVA